MNHLTVRTEATFASLLELAANNDIEGFKEVIEHDPSCIDEIGTWYGREKGSRKMVLEDRTPLMVAALYGSVDVVKLILSLSVGDVNRCCGSDGSTALHCAASGGSNSAAVVVKLLLSAGADLDVVDSNGHRPIDVLAVPPKLQYLQLSLEELLSTNGSGSEHDARVSGVVSNSMLSPVENGYHLTKIADVSIQPAAEKKEYPVDPSLPDIKNSIYSTDEFRMFSFKIRPCSRAYSHDWTECPFVHPGENARRRDPRKFHYSCVPCPDFRKGACRRGDMCEYAHGVFECWLHPAQYRTRLCKDGTNCNRRVCFFAHTTDELRPLYVSTGSAVPSPRAMDIATAMSLLPGSPSSVSVMSPSPFTPPMSPSACSISQSSMAWSQQNVPMLHLPGNNLQSSRLRSSLCARDIPVGDYSLLPDLDAQQQQILNELSYISQPNSLTRSARSKNLNPSNLDDLFSESSSPRYSDQSLTASMYSPTHKSAVLNQFQQQQSMLSPINTAFSPKNMDHPLIQSPFSGRMSPRNADPISPMSSRVSTFTQPDNQVHFRSLSSRDLGSSSATLFGSRNIWGSTNGKPDWPVGTDEPGKLRRSSSFELGRNSDEPDLSWVQSLVKESAHETGENCVEDEQPEPVDHTVLGAWMEQMQLDQLAAK